MALIQNELNQVMKEWNTHTIRPSRNVETPHGKPDLLFYLQVINGRCILFTFFAFSN